MGTVLRIEVAAPSRTSALAASEAAFRAVQRVDGAISSWRRDSDVGRLNASAARRPVHAPELIALIDELTTWSVDTEGAFDPVVGALIEAWDLRGAGRYASAEDVVAALRRTGLRHLRVDAAHDALQWTVDGAWLDAGGFGKGLALRVARAALDSAGVTAARLDFGGQTLATGSDRHASWLVGVAHPDRRSHSVAALRLQNASAATSGQSERHRELDGQVVGHIVDPRTGYPVSPWGSVTVVSADPMVADIVATALFVMGPDAAMAWARERQDVGVLALEVVDDVLVRRTNQIMEQLLQ
jgi:thiamine biosynthesis lipoprotein